MGLLHLLLLTLSKATPLMLAALGGMLAELAGVVNFALEGMMLAGCFGAVWGAYATGSPWAGLLAGAFGGVLIGALHATASLRFRANQIVSSIAVNLLAAGVTGMLLHEIFHTYGTSPDVPALPAFGAALWGAVPEIGDRPARSLPSVSVMVPASLALAAVLVTAFKRSVWGLRVRACGENPEAARAAGLAVSRIRYTAVLASGALAGLGGAYLSIGELSQFVERMTQGRGYLAVAALILARWRPWGVLAAALFFGFSEALAEFLAVRQPLLPSQFFLALPYLICLALLVSHLGRHRPPSALGRLE
jgi:simple sugar transport system permease protein